MADVEGGPCRRTGGRARGTSFRVPDRADTCTGGFRATEVEEVMAEMVDKQPVRARHSKRKRKAWSGNRSENMKQDSLQCVMQRRPFSASGGSTGWIPL